jgi:hypothetical protein
MAFGVQKYSKGNKKQGCGAENISFGSGSDFSLVGTYLHCIVLMICWKEYGTYVGNLFESCSRRIMINITTFI